MAQVQDGLPPISLLLLAVALLLFGAGGGLVGYMAGERHGETRAVAIVQALGAQWDAYRGEAKSRFDQAIEDTAAQLERAASDLKAEVPMYHGCGAICTAIANRFSEELLHARDTIKKSELAPLTDWRDALRESGAPIEWNASLVTIELNSAYSSATVLATIVLLCATVALCFGIACFTILKLRAGGTDPA